MTAKTTKPVSEIPPIPNSPHSETAKMIDKNTDHATSSIASVNTAAKNTIGANHQLLQQYPQ